jgi:hypothetical protein
MGDFFFSKLPVRHAIRTMTQFMSGEPADWLQHRYRHSLQAVDVINDLCALPMLLRDWFSRRSTAR